MKRILVVDDNRVIRHVIRQMLETCGLAVEEAEDGVQCLKQCREQGVPDGIILDINMPEMDGFETAQWIKTNHPEVMVLALSMYDNETSIIRMLKCGAKGYILKDSEPAELKAAIAALMDKGFYYSDLVSGKLMHAINKMDDDGDGLKNLVPLNDRETDFLKYACTEMTYKEIADKMFVSPRTIDGYRDTLFEKLHLKTRVGLVMYAIKNGIVNV